MGVDIPSEGLRQLERAGRLLDVQGGLRGAPPVHKALEQLFGEARYRSQPHGLLSVTSPGLVGASRLLQGPEAQRFEREISDLQLSIAGGRGAGGGSAQELKPEEKDSLEVREFFGLRHEKVLLGVIEEAHRDAMRAFERSSRDRIDRDWEETRSKILNTMAPHQVTNLSTALRGATGASSSGAGTLVAPPHDAAIIQLLSESTLARSVMRIGQLCSESCPPYKAELLECWGIISQQLEPNLPAVIGGSLRYLQQRYAEEIEFSVYRSPDGRLGGIPDAWSHVCAFGRMKFESAAFPSVPQHIWYIAYVAARAGYSNLLLDLPARTAPLSERCPMLADVCRLMARRLEATARGAGSAAVAEVDHAQLLRADLLEDGGPFHDVLVALLNGKPYAFGRLPEATIEDWLWFRLHGVHMASAGTGSQSADFLASLNVLRKDVLQKPPSHYDPTPGSSSVAPSGMLGLGDPFTSSPAGSSLVGSGIVAGVTQTLNFAKVLLLTAQFGQAVQQLRSQDRTLFGPAMHMALVLRRAGTPDESDQELNVTHLIGEYASQFGYSDQLRYFRLLAPRDRAHALKGLLLRGGVGTNEELIGYIDSDGGHRPGLLETTLLEGQPQGGLGERVEFVGICAQAGKEAAEHGQYREALRLLHLGRCYNEVLQVLCRCLRLPVWHELTGSASQEIALLGQDIQRFFVIYEVNLERYALNCHGWAVARKLYAARMFHSFSDSGQPALALDVFDREQLLPLDTSTGQHGAEVESEVVAEYPRIVSNYVKIMHHAASQGAVVPSVLQGRVHQLQAFLAVHSQRLVLDQDTVAALANLTLLSVA